MATIETLSFRVGKEIGKILLDISQEDILNEIPKRLLKITPMDSA